MYLKGMRLLEAYRKVKVLISKRLSNTKKTKKPKPLEYAHMARACGLSYGQIRRIIGILEREKFIESFYTYPQFKTCKMYRLV